MTENEKLEALDLLMYLSENGYDFEELTFDDFLKYSSLAFIRETVADFFGEDPLA